MTRTRIVLGILGGIAALALAAVWTAFEWRPSADDYQERYAAEQAELGEQAGEGLRVTFLGVSTLLIRDESAAILIDGFFSRPGKLALAGGSIAPDLERIAAALPLLGTPRLDAVIPVHSHYDHAMDSPVVAERTGAVLVGSPSTANIARGLDFPQERLRVVTGPETMRFGNLTVTLVPSKHFPHGQAMGEIDAPLAPPAGATDYKEGGSFSILVEREGRGVLVQGSAGFVEGALRGRRADVVYLGVGLLGSKDEAYREAYWRETVAAVGARRVVPIHWDDFTRGLDEPLVPLPYLLDNLETSMHFVAARAEADRIDLDWPPFALPTDPFAGLAPAAAAP
jgi:L-ascorbate metabolism protein UlaG (beta-lactamase superfamily)